MAVFRVEKNKGYTVMSNHHLRNKELSLKAKGLLSQMLSLPEDWDYTLAGLSLINREKIDAIREAVRELENAGYIQRSRERDEKGRLRGTTYVIYEQPPKLDLPILEKPTLDNPTLEKPMLEKPTLENPTQLNKEIQKTNLPTKEKLNTDISSTHSIPFHSLRIHQHNFIFCTGNGNRIGSRHIVEFAFDTGRTGCTFAIIRGSQRKRPQKDRQGHEPLYGR